MKMRGMLVGTLLLVLLVGAGSLFGLAAAGAAERESIPAVAPEPAASAGPTVTISNFTFAPKVVRVKAGTEVTWQVKEGTHTVNADNGSFESPTLSAGKSFTHSFATAGTYRYYCSFHGSKGGHDMSGTVVVTK